jgi:hypothetical protein
VITLAPNRWQGYLRSARILLKARRPEAAITMIEYANTRIPPDDSKRRSELEGLKAEALHLHQQHATSSLARPSTGHPIRLPFELWAEIFRWVVLPDHTKVLVLSSVCRQWRGIAFDTAALWDTLVLTRRHPVAKIQTWINRSKGIIRKLQVTEAVVGDPDLLPALKRVPWKAIRALKLEGSAIGLMDHVSLIELSSVENLELNTTNYRGSATACLLRHTGATLRHLTMQDANNPAITPVLPPSTMLVSITLRRVALFNLDVLLDMLRTNPLLECVILETVCFFALEPFSIPSSSPAIHLPALTRLEMIGKLPPLVYTNTFFPALQALVIKDQASIYRDLFDARNMNSLRELRIQRCGVPDSLYPFLRGLSSLETLQLSDIADAAKHFMNALTTPLNEAVVCPSLTHLDFSGCQDLQSGPLIRLIKARLPEHSKETSSECDADNAEVPHVARISTLNIDRCPLIDVETLPWIRSTIPCVSSCVHATRKQASWRR